MWSYNYTNELYHHGIKGMKWGVRRHKKKELKSNYKAKVKGIKENYKSERLKIGSMAESSKQKAKEQYDKETAPSKKKRDDALNKASLEYESIKKNTKQLYEPSIDKHMKNAERYESDADFWGRESDIGKKSIAKSNEHLNKAIAEEARYNAAKEKSRVDYNTKVINIKTRYDSETLAATNRYREKLNKINAEQQELYSRNGELYMEDLMNVKNEYKQARKNLKNR